MLLSSTGEQFDLAAFGGLTNYGATRTRGFVSAALLSSIHIRTTEFEMQCTPRHTAAEFEPKFGCGCRLAASAQPMRSPALLLSVTPRDSSPRVPEHCPRGVEVTAAAEVAAAAEWAPLLFGPVVPERYTDCGHTAAEVEPKFVCGCRLTHPLPAGQGL